MFLVELSNIRWADKNNKSTAIWTYLVDDMAEVTWQDIYENSFRGNRFEFRRLLKDVFQAEAERQLDRSILQCKITIQMRSCI